MRTYVEFHRKKQGILSFGREFGHGQVGARTIVLKRVQAALVT